MAHPRIGVWLIGGKGGVASTTILGLVALQKGLIGTTGLVSALPQFQHLDLPAWDDLVVGGHEIRRTPLGCEALRVATEMRAVSPALVAQCNSELTEIDRRLRPGTVHNVGSTIAGLADLDLPRDESPRQAVERIQRDLREFAAASRLDHVVVVNVASTEPPLDVSHLPGTWAELEKCLGDSRCGRSPEIRCGRSPDRATAVTEGLAEAGETLRSGLSAGSGDPRRTEGCGWSPDRAAAAAVALPASSLYAIAALDLGCSYINFTPSLGAAPPAIGELAQLRGTRHTGCDGKTGETLLKSVLAPMFARRNLRVLSWVGHNIFGNMDGQVLNDPANKQAKIASKEHLVGDILGYRPQTHVSIEYIESLGDWKTAWDHIHFAGFLGTPMTMQFIWQGCDSVLAAPLVLDLVRFTEAARRRGETGLLRFLASFWKSPLGVEEQRFDRQFGMLEEWATK